MAVIDSYVAFVYLIFIEYEISTSFIKENFISLYKSIYNSKF